MLVLSRKVGEQICVPQFEIVLTVLVLHATSTASAGSACHALASCFRIGVIWRPFRAILVFDCDNNAVRDVLVV